MAFTGAKPLRLTTTPLTTAPMQPFLPPKDPWWKDWLADPLMWVLDKFNRPQQAIFAGVHEGLTAEAEVTPWKRAWDAFWHGDDVRMVDIMDEIGLKGQAGKFDPLDILAAAGEIILDPINLIGIGAVGKLGKVGKFVKTADLAADEVKAMATLSKYGMKVDDLKRFGLARPGQYGKQVLDDAQRLLGPDSLSHYLTVGVGKSRVAVPGTQYGLEPFVRAGRWTRGKMRGFLSTQPRTMEEAIPQALKNLVEKQRAGAIQLAGFMERQLPQAWRKGKLVKAVETGNRAIIEGAPEAVQEAFDTGVWFSKHLPELEEMSGVMTRKFGVGGVGQTTFADFLDTQGLEHTSEEAVNYFVHALHPDVRKYMQANDVRWKKAFVGLQTPLKASHASQIMREIPGTIDEINTAAKTKGIYTFHPKGKLLSFYKQSGHNAQAVEMATKDWAVGNITDAVRNISERIGEDATKLFDSAFHYEKFDQYFIDDWGKALGIRLGRHVRSRAVAETMQQVFDAKDELTGMPMWALPAAEGAPGYKALDIPQKLRKSLTPEFLTKVDNLHLKDEIADALTDGLRVMYDPGPRTEFLSMARQGLSWIRASTILPFAGYHVANVMGNRWGRWLAGVADVQYDKMSYQLMKAIGKGDVKTLNKMSLTLGGKTYKGNELMHSLFQHDVMTGGSMTAEVLGYGRFAPGPMDIGEGVRMRDLINPLSRRQAGAFVARRLEDHDRVALYLGRLNKGDNMADAAASVDKHMFRYSDLTKIEAGTATSAGIKDTTLFYTWYRKNIGLTMQKMWEYPGRMSLPIKVRNALNGAYGDPDSEYAVPSYLKDQFYFYLGKDREGKPRFLDPEKYMPPLSAAKFFGGGLAGAGREAVGMLIPPLKAGAEAAFGKEAFTGRELEGVPGQKRFMFGGEITPALAYAAKNVRMINTINRTLFPAAEGAEGRVRAGEPGARPPGAYGTAAWREYAGVKLQTTDVQRNRYFEAVSPSGRINADLDKIASKMAGKVSPLQRTSYMQARTALLWEKAEILRQMIEDGTDPFTGKPMEWQPPMPEPGTRRPHTMREIHTEMYTTLRGLYFGEPPTPGVLMVEPKTLLQPAEAQQVFDTMARLKVDMLGKDAQYAVRHKSKDILDNRVLGPIRDILRTENYYERTGKKPSWDTHIYDYPLNFRQSLIPLWYQYMESAHRTGLIDEKGVKTRLKTFQELYEVDYRG